MRKFIIIAITLFVGIASTEMSAQNPSQKGVFGGGKKVAGGSYKVKGSMSQGNVGKSAGGDFNAISGFWGSQASNIVTGPPTLMMDSLILQSYYAGTCYFRITDIGNSAITKKGVCWSTVSSPTINDYKTEDVGIYGVASYAMVLNGLSPSNVYHIRAYAQNSAGVAYSNEITINTIPTLPEWGMIALGSLLVGMSVWFAIKRIS